jgi:hypothetical protein
LLFLVRYEQLVFDPVPLALHLDLSRSREHSRLFNTAAVSILWYL